MKYRNIFSPFVKSKKIKWILLGLLVLVILFSQTQVFNKPLSEDSGMSLYHGKRILEGNIPYRDTWEHKGPLIFYINALGLFLGGGSSWGVWTIQFLFILASALIGFFLIKKVFGNFAAIFATILWISSLVFVLEGGNLMESYNLFFQFAIFYLFFESERKGKYEIRGFLIGILGGASFFLRQNLIGVFLSVIIFLILKRAFKGDWKKFLRASTVIFSGFFLVLGLVFYYFAAHGAFSDLIDQTFRFNFVYSTTSLLSKLEAPFMGTWILSRTGISFIGFTAFILGVLSFSKVHSLVQLALIAFPLELVLSSISGISPPHYFMAWLPSLAVLSSFFAHSILRFMKGKRGKTLAFALAVSFSIPSLGLTFYIYSGLGSCEAVGLMLIPSYHFSECKNPKSQVSEYIRANTNPDEYVLIWGFAGSLNFLSGRSSPSRFTYHYPLFLQGYTNQTITNGFLEDIVKKPPLLVIDASSDHFRVPPLDPRKREGWSGGVILSPMEDFFEFFNSNYRFIESIEDWQIYEYLRQR